MTAQNPPAETDTLGDAKEWLRERLDEGAHCPLCTQMAKVYRRKLNTSMAAALIQFWRVHGRDWGHAPTTGTIARLGGDWAQLRMWGLTEELTEPREDGGRAGWWRLTELGVQFVANQFTVPKYVRLYDGRLMGHAGDQVTIVDALGDRFDYSELMATSGAGDDGHTEGAIP